MNGYVIDKLRHMLPLYIQVNNNNNNLNKIHKLIMRTARIGNNCCRFSRIRLTNICK